MREIAKNLDEAIHRLNEDLERVELWTAALSAFLQPIPSYDSAYQDFLLPRAESTHTSPARKALKQSA